MSRFARTRRRPDHWPTPHARARARAAERLDGPLGLAEASWLDEHLAGCVECAAIAAQYDADRASLRVLRDAPPEPPRDLWARTAAAIEREAGATPSTAPADANGMPGAALAADGRSGRPFRGLPMTALSGLAVAVVVIAIGVVSTGLLDGGNDVAVIDTGSSQTTVPGGGPEITGSDEPPTIAPQPTPLLANAGDVAWVQRSVDGLLAFTNAPIDRVCPVDGRSGCATLDDDDEGVLDLTGAPKYVIRSPIDRQAVVVSDDGAGGDRLVVVSLPKSRDGGGPRPTADPGESPTPTPTPADTATPTPTTEPVATPTTAPTQSADPTESATPTGSADPTESATPEPILTPEPTVAVSVALATDITLVGQSAAFSPDGAWFAFTARATDASSGPDVYVWRVGDAEATPLTDDGISTFGSWVDGSVVVSRPAEPDALDATAAVSVTIDPATGEEAALDGTLWRPAVDPSGDRAVAWVGTVAFDAEARTWRPAEGRLALVAWPPTGEEPIEALIEGPAADMDVRWDESGEWVAVWVADSLEGEIGRLSLFRVDPDNGRLDKLKGAPTEEPALAGFSIGQGRVAWVGPAGEDGEGSYIHVAAWVGRDVGTAESVPGQGIVVVR